MSKTPTQVEVDNNTSSDNPVKKSVVLGLPKVAAVKSGFANGGRPDFKAKTSKATGAKKRVRQ